MAELEAKADREFMEENGLTVTGGKVLDAAAQARQRGSHHEARANALASVEEKMLMFLVKQLAFRELSVADIVMVSRFTMRLAADAVCKVLGEDVGERR